MFGHDIEAFESSRPPFILRAGQLRHCVVCRFDPLTPRDRDRRGPNADRRRKQTRRTCGDGEIASKMLWYYLWLYFSALLFGHSPRVQLRGTSIIGKHFQELNQDFFGGTSFHHFALVYYPLILCLIYDSLSGIPFADPPVASLRFAPPQLKRSLTPLRSFDARSYGPSCLQPESSFYYPPYSPSEPKTILQDLDADMSEDCLTLNIFRPSSIDSLASLPVMVWIYGGGFYGERCTSDSYVTSTHISRWTIFAL